MGVGCPSGLRDSQEQLRLEGMIHQLVRRDGGVRTIPILMTEEDKPTQHLKRESRARGTPREAVKPYRWLNQTALTSSGWIDL